jgi:hypothetical protein
MVPGFIVISVDAAARVGDAPAMKITIRYCIVS